MLKPLQDDPLRWRRACLSLLLVVFVFCLRPVLRDIAFLARLPHQGLRPQIDLHVYETAGYLVLTGKGAHLYDGALDGTDPQFKVVPADTEFARAGDRLGFDHLGMYVYPPLLADVVAPLMLLGPSHAAAVWNSVSLLCLLGSLLLLARMRDIPPASGGFLLILGGALCVHAIYLALWWGQATPLLLFCVVAGIASYTQGRLALSATALSFAVAIKLTPLLLFVPFVVWQEWRWLRYAATCLAGWFVLMAAVNGRTVLAQCAGQVLPAMSNGIAHPGNLSILGAVQVQLLRHGMPVSAHVLTATRVSIVCMLAAFFAIVFTRRRRMGTQSRGEVLAAAATLSIAVSPVSWMHAYVLVLPLLVLLWIRCFRGNATLLVLSLTFLTSLQLTQLSVEANLLRPHHAVALLPLLTPLAAIVAAFTSVLSVGERASTSRTLTAVG